MKRREVANHFLLEACQYIVLNAADFKIEVIWEMLRAAAAAAGPNTNLYAEIIETINDLKQYSSQRVLTAHTAWMMVSGLSTRTHGQQGTNPVMINFMTNMKRVNMTDYLLVPEITEEQDALLFQGEKRFYFNRLSRSRSSKCVINPGIENKSSLLHKCNDRMALLMEINSKGKSDKSHSRAYDCL